MNLGPDLLDILCCPETRQPVHAAPPALLEQLNRQIASGTLSSRGGRLIKEKLEGGLVRQDGKFLYPVRQAIPVMLANEAVPIT